MSTFKQRMALMLASEDGHSEIVNTLVRSHADVNVRNKDGESALDLAKLNHHDSVVDILIGVQNQPTVNDEFYPEEHFNLKEVESSSTRMTIDNSASESKVSIANLSYCPPQLKAKRMRFVRQKAVKSIKKPLHILSVALGQRNISSRLWNQDSKIPKQDPKIPKLHILTFAFRQRTLAVTSD